MFFIDVVLNGLECFVSDVKIFIFGNELGDIFLSIDSDVGEDIVMDIFFGVCLVIFVVWVGGIVGFHLFCQ